MPSVEQYEAVETYVHLGPDGTAVPLPVTGTFWEELSSGAFGHLGPGRLVSSYAFREDWTSWEMHPAGEELVVLVSGAMDLILDADGREQRLALASPGQYLIVPRGVWHTADVREGALALFVTPGEGTEVRPRA